MLTFAGGGTRANALLGDTYVAAYGDATPAVFFSVPANRVLQSIEVVVLTPFNGIGATLKIGTALDDDRFFANTDSELSDLLSFGKYFSDQGPFDLQLTIAAGFGATRGQVQIQTVLLPSP